MKPKVCTICGIEKHYTDFHKRSDRPIGIQSACKECQRRWQKDHPQSESMKHKEPSTICDTCGKAYFTYWKRGKYSFCSKQCQDTFTGGGELVKCEFCGKMVYRKKSKLDRNEHFFCSRECCDKSKRTASYAKRMLSNGSYRKWRANLLKNAQCLFCGSIKKLELHHVESRKDNPDRVRDEGNVIPICKKCHDIFHSNNSKSSELRETLSAILAYGNPQPSRSNVLIFVGRKVQRLTGEDITTNKPDTSAAPERDEIVRACSKE